MLRMRRIMKTSPREIPRWELGNQKKSHNKPLANASAHASACASGTARGRKFCVRARGQHAPLAPLINVNGNEKADVIVFFRLFLDGKQNEQHVGFALLNIAWRRKCRRGSTHDKKYTNILKTQNTMLKYFQIYFSLSA